MATHAHSTRTPLLPQSGSAPPLSGQGLGRRPGPVTQAIRALRAPTWHLHGVRPIGDDRPDGIRALSRAEVDDLVGGLIDLLDAWDGDTEREATALWSGQAGASDRPVTTTPRMALTPRA